MKNRVKHAVKIVVGTAAAFLPFSVFAASAKDVVNEGLTILTATGLGSRDIRETIGSVINIFMGLLGTVAIVIILIGGFQWMTAGGNEEKVEKAKQMLGAGVIGLAIILAAYSITRFVVGSLINAT